MTSTAFYLRSSALIGGLFVLSIAGCTDDPSSTSVQDDQKAALKDPFNYGPNAASMGGRGEDLDRTNITGGEVDNLDKKAMKRDLQSVFGP